MRLIDITKENWEDVIFLSTNETITVKGSGEPYEAKGMPSLCEEFVASNALSIFNRFMKMDGLSRRSNMMEN